MEMTDAATTPVVAASRAPTNRAEELSDGVEEVLGHAGALEDQPHEREERDREQHFVAHSLVEALG
jgi:hypothetical protein